MTKEEIAYLLKRYRYIVKIMEQKKASECFVIGDKKERIAIDENTKTFVEAVQRALELEPDEYVRNVLKQILMSGDNDYYIYLTNNLTKSSFYRLKGAFTEFVFCLCILRGLVSESELKPPV